MRPLTSGSLLSVSKVVKVEKVIGDMIRGVFYQFPPNNRGKRSMTMDPCLWSLDSDKSLFRSRLVLKSRET